MALEITQAEAGALRVLALSGRLDTETSSDLELTLQDLLGAGERNFLLDLGGIGYVSSAGLRVLLGLAKQLDGGKGTLRLCGLSPAVRQVFDVAGFGRLFAIFPNREAALGDAPRVKAEAVLAQRTAGLLGIGPAVATMRPEAAELARAAALLLGVRLAAAAKSGASARIATPAVSRPAAQKQRSGPAQPNAVGIVAKLRRWFGGKS